MEKLKTQEAAFPTFPQGPLPENETEITTTKAQRGDKGGALTSASFSTGPDGPSRRRRRGDF